MYNIDSLKESGGVSIFLVSFLTFFCDHQTTPQPKLGNGFNSRITHYRGRCEGPRHRTTLVKGYIGGLDDRGAAYIREAAATVVTVISVVHLFKRHIT